MAFNFNISFGSNRIADVERDASGNWFYRLFTGNKAKRYKDTKHKYQTVVSNPALLKVFVFMADTFSQVNINKYQNKKLVEENFLYSIAKRPNDWQTWTEFLWEYRFWLATGNAYVYSKNDVFYCLKPYGIELTESQRKAFKRLSFSKYGDNTKRNVKKGTFKYRNDNGEVSDLDLSNLHIFSDLSNGVTGDWFEGNSRLDALYKIINNSELALDAEGINLEFAGKFLVSGDHDINNTSSLPMGDEEKLSAESSLRSSKKVHVLKDKVNINQFVSNLSSLKLPESYLNTLFLVGNMYSIPKDVIEAIAKGATYENQEKSMGRYVDYGEMPKVQQLTDWCEIEFEVDEVKGSFAHLPFNSVFEKERIDNNKTQMETYKMASELGINVQKEVTELIKKMQ